MPWGGGESCRTFHGILPADNVEGSDTEILGRFIDFAEKIFLFKREIAKKRDLDGWADLLIDFLVEIFEPDQDRQLEFSQLLELFASLKSCRAKADFTSEVDFEVIQSFLDEQFSQGGLATGFMNGAVTFCELLPMRAVPFKCVCLLGMNEGDFPRITSAPSFDLIVSHSEMGDRNKKNDDRYLFLETILSARNTLYVSYVGQSNKDGSRLLPSVPISELLDYLGPLVDGEWDPLTCHPMHAFNEKYFIKDNSLVNFSKADYQASRALAINVPPTPLIDTGLPELPDEQRKIALESLIGFFKNPVKYFCRHRLGIRLDGSAYVPEGTESFVVDSLQRYKMGNWLMEQTLAGTFAADAGEILRLQGSMPHGSVGRVEIAGLEEEVRSLVDKISSMRVGEGTRLAEGEVEAAPFSISGTVSGCEKSGNQLLYRFAAVTAADQVSGWIHHLFYNCLADAAGNKQTIVVGRDKTIVFDAVPDCLAVFSDLLEMYWRGMRKPLPFFPKTSLAYVDSLVKAGEQAALLKAESVWSGSDFSKGEGDDPYYKLYLRETSPLEGEFGAVAMRFFAPLAGCRRFV